MKTAYRISSFNPEKENDEVYKSRSWEAIEIARADLETLEELLEKDDLTGCSNVALDEAFYKAFSEIKQRAGKDDLEKWDDLVKGYGDCLIECCKRAEGRPEYRALADELIKCFLYYDNWLLRYIELSTGDKNWAECSNISDQDKLHCNERYYEEVEAWVRRLESYSGEKHELIVKSLYGVLIDRYRSEGEKDKLINALDKQTSEVDSTELSVMITALLAVEDHGIRYCTNNTMALIKMLYDSGDKERAACIIREIDDVPRDKEEYWHSIDVYGKLLCLCCKYILLLEEIGFSEKAAEWRTKLIDDFGKSEESVRGTIAFLKGDHLTALQQCRIEYENLGKLGKNYEQATVGRKINLLEYIISGKLPVRSDGKSITVLEEDPEGLYSEGFRGIYSDPWDEGIYISNQYRNIEWKQTVGTFLETAEDFVFKAVYGKSATVYPPEHYILECNYDIEPALVRGEYIKRLYEGSREED